MDSFILMQRRQYNNSISTEATPLTSNSNVPLYEKVRERVGSMDSKKSRSER